MKKAGAFFCLGASSLDATPVGVGLRGIRPTQGSGATLGYVRLPLFGYFIYAEQRGEVHLFRRVL